MLEGKKIAIVYDWIDKWGGVERLLLTLLQIFPKAKFYSSYFDRQKAVWAKNIKIRSSFIQKLPNFVKGNRIASLPFYPFAFESLDFKNFDLVITVTSSFAKAVITRPETTHICYLLTPTRYLWVFPDGYLNNPILKYALSPYLAKLRNWDFFSAQRPDRIISISQTVADRCWKYYKRESEVIYPPFDSEYWNKIKKAILRAKPKESLNLFQKILQIREIHRFARNDNSGKYFLVVSRPEPYKKVNLVIQLFNQLNHRLVIVGEGSQLERLKRMAGENIIFLNRISDQELGILYSKAEALIIPQEEDFGYVALEAQFFACPVIALARGGARETVIEGKTGIFFPSQTIDSIQKALSRFDMVKYRLRQSTKEFGQKSVERFDKKKFINKFLNHL